MGDDAPDPEFHAVHDLNNLVLAFGGYELAFMVVDPIVFDREFAVDAGDDDVVVLWIEGFVYQEKGIGRDEGVDHAVALATDNEGGVGMGDQVVQIDLLRLIRFSRCRSAGVDGAGEYGKQQWGDLHKTNFCLEIV